MVSQKSDPTFPDLEYPTQSFTASPSQKPSSSNAQLPLHWCTIQLPTSCCTAMPWASWQGAHVALVALVALVAQVPGDCSPKKMSTLLFHQYYTSAISTRIIMTTNSDIIPYLFFGGVLCICYAFHAIFMSLQSVHSASNHIEPKAQVTVLQGVPAWWVGSSNA